MSDDKVRVKTEVPFPYEKVLALIEELENQAQVMRKHNELVEKLQQLVDNWENRRMVIKPDDDVRLVAELKDLILEYKL